MDEKSLDSFSDVRKLISDLFQVRPVMYWVDLTISAGIGWGGFWLAGHTSWQAPLWKMTWLLASALAFFHALVFTHEIAHQRKEDLPGFCWFWNLICGFLFFLPSFTYLAHTYHHRVATFSTKDDLEYLPWAGKPVHEILLPFLIFPILPVLSAIRFLVAGPISLMVGGPLREWLLRHASTLKMNARFEWRNITEWDRRLGVQEEAVQLIWWMLFLAGCMRFGFNLLVDWYLIFTLTLIINHARSLARHRYAYTGEKISFEAQVLDSVTISGFSPLAPLLMPIGLRYHSVHHMFPSLPYHAMRAAHLRLQCDLPKDHLYFKTLVPTFTQAWFNIFKTKTNV